MSVTEPEIDALLEKTDHNPFLLCAVASKRACDINNMIHGLHLRVNQAQEHEDVTLIVSGLDTTSVAMTELADDKLGYVKEDFEDAIMNTNTPRETE